MDLIQKIAKSRNVLLEMLSERGYQTAPYENFTIDDINIMFNQFQKSKSSASPAPGALDLVLEKDDKDGKSKTYVKYRLDRYRANKPILKLIDRIYGSEEGILEPNDTLILIVIESISQMMNLEKSLAGLYDEYGYYIQVFNLDILQNNITKLDIVPEHRILSKKETEALLEKFNARAEDFPVIRRLDPAAKYYAIRPGEICEILRNTETSGIGHYYRHCVQLT
jgi:DNA-directed RNA polymerase subunit H (RpoH/RPB5)